MLAALVLGSRRATIYREILVTQRLSGIVCKYQKNPKFSLISPYYTVKQFYYKLSFFSTTMLKNPGSRNGGPRSGGRELIKKGIKCFTYQRKKEHHLKLLNIARIEETCIHFA